MALGCCQRFRDRPAVRCRSRRYLRRTRVQRTSSTGTSASPLASGATGSRVWKRRASPRGASRRPPNVSPRASRQWFHPTPAERNSANAWDLSIHALSENPDMAWALIEIMMRPENITTYPDAGLPPYLSIYDSEAYSSDYWASVAAHGRQRPRCSPDPLLPGVRQHGLRRNPRGHQRRPCGYSKCPRRGTGGA